MEKGPAIIRVGSFAKNGMPIGWHLDAKGVSDVLEIKNEDVFIGGVLMVQLTAYRKKIMAGPHTGGC